MPNVQLISGQQTVSSIDDVNVTNVSAKTPDAEEISLLPEPTGAMVSDDAVARLAMLFTELDQESRSASRKREAAADAARAREDAAQVTAMHEKADDIRAGGLLTGLMEIGAGAAQFGASMSSISATSAGRSASAVQNDKVLSAVLTGSAKGMDAGSKVATSQYRGLEADNDADAKAHANAAAVHERVSRAAHEDAAVSTESLKKVLEWVKEMHAAQHGAQLTAASMLRG